MEEQMFSLRKIRVILAFGLVAACVSVGTVGADSLTRVSSEQSSQSSEDIVVKRHLWRALAAFIHVGGPSTGVSLRNALNYSSPEDAKQDKDEGRNCPIPKAAVAVC